MAMDKKDSSAVGRNTRQQYSKIGRPFIARARVKQYIKEKATKQGTEAI